MATYYGYRTINHNSYNAWKTATLGNSYDVDYYPIDQPFQCWDYCSLAYFQYGRILLTKAGGGTAADCWNVSRAYNSKSPFISVTGKENIKKGDIVVFNVSSRLPFGHIGFADENYNGTNYIRVLGQNQAGHPYVDTQNYNLIDFLGIFRNRNWDSTPQPPPDPPSTTTKKRKFPWPVAWAHWDNFKI